MLPGQLEQIQTWFTSYASRFEDPNGALHPFLRLKHDHSHYVAENARLIATALDWTKEDILTAEALGLLHDVGRFTQFKEFKSFRDADTIDHGFRGWEIIRCGEILSDFASLDQKRILNGIKFHNKKEIPDEFDTDTLQFIALIRDADKLDIFRVVQEAAASYTTEEFIKMFPGVTPEGSPNPELVEAIQKGETPSFGLVKTFCGMQLILLSWIPQIIFPPTQKLIQERGILNWISETLPTDPDVQDIALRATQQLNESIAAH